MLRLFVLSATLAAASACWCVNNDDVNIRATACGTIIGNVNRGNCYKSQNKQETCVLSGTTYTYEAFDYGGGSGWIANNYLDKEDSSKCSGGGATCGAARIVTRAEWGARPPTSSGTPLWLPLSKHFVHHSAGSHCYNEADCSAQVRGIQNWQMDYNGYSDIGYNWLVGEDGNIYEGRGWSTQGAHASSWNAQSHGTCVIGTFTSGMPNNAALNALQSIIDCGVNDGATVSGYDLHGHRSGGCTECPGDRFYPGWVQPHPHYGGTLDGSCLKEEWGPSILYN